MKRLVDDKKQELLDNLLESVSVDNKGNVEVGKNLDVDGALTINSAKDLKTKDGTSFGGGGLPSPWAANEKVLGVEDTENKNVIGFLSEGGFLYGCHDNQTGESCYLSPVYLGNTSVIFYLNAKTQVESEIVLPDDFMTKSQVINLGDINKKQATLYRHTVTFSENGLGYNNRFTAYSEKSTPIDSIQDLISVFGNTKLQCSGTTNSGSEPCIGIDVGTDADTTFFINITGVKQKISSWYSTQPESTLTITDSVTAM